MDVFSAFFTFGWTFVPWPFFPSGPIFRVPFFRGRFFRGLYFRGPFFLHSLRIYRTIKDHRVNVYDIHVKYSLMLLAGTHAVCGKLLDGAVA